MNASRWTRHVLTLVGVYYLLSGMFNAIFPKVAFKIAEMDVPIHLFVWQHISIMFAVLGFGFLIAASDPTRFWPIVFMGLLKMLFGIGGFIALLSTGCVSHHFGIHVLLADGLWIIPMLLVLRWTFVENNRVEESLNYLSFFEDNVELTHLKDQNNEPILPEGCTQPTMLVFLRHFGCAFCKETLHTLKKEKPIIDKLGTRLVIVHLCSDEVAEKHLKKYGLDSVSRVSDPQSKIYSAFNLEQVKFTELFNLKGFIRLIDVFIFKGIMQGKIIGNPYQLAGVFLVKDNVVVNAFRHRTVADTPDYIRLASPETL